jgi:hypothetical protein
MNNQTKEKKMELAHSGRIPVVITTDHTKRGVFLGWINPDDAFNENIVAHEVRMAVRFSREIGGVLGLANPGPDKNCRISKAHKKAHIKGVTAVFEATDEAVKKWRKEPWLK